MEAVECRGCVWPDPRKIKETIESSWNAPIAGEPGAKSVHEWHSPQKTERAQQFFEILQAGCRESLGVRVLHDEPFVHRDDVLCPCALKHDLGDQSEERSLWTPPWEGPVVLASPR